MWSDRLSARLRRLYGGASPVPEDLSDPPAALEQALLREHAARHPPTRRPAPARPGLRGFLAGHRAAFAGVGLALAAAAACQLPSDYERAFGSAVSCDLSRETWSDGQIEGLAETLARTLGAHGLAVRVHDGGGPTLALRLDMWGVEVDDGALLEALRAEAPELATDACRNEPIAGTVHGTLGGRLGYGLLDLDLDRADAAATRLEILAELERRGVEGGAQIDIRDDGDGKRAVQIRIEAHPRRAPR